MSHKQGQLRVSTNIVNRQSSMSTTASEPSPQSTNSPVMAPAAPTRHYSSADSYVYGPTAPTQNKTAYHSSADAYAYGWLPPMPPWLG
ncbi:hypothetical protein FRB93_010323 [Tulasnella sp. JGI-2019a]|nr:hypothetical protein FRB93_010323 [Tulasnella sp. JGI-2019a]